MASKSNMAAIMKYQLTRDNNILWRQHEKKPNPNQYE